MRTSGQQVLGASWSVSALWWTEHVSTETYTLTEGTTFGALIKHTTSADGMLLHGKVGITSLHTESKHVRRPRCHKSFLCVGFGGFMRQRDGASQHATPPTSELEMVLAMLDYTRGLLFLRVATLMPIGSSQAGPAHNSSLPTCVSQKCCL